MSHSQLEPLPPNRLEPHPQPHPQPLPLLPLQQNSNRIIQIQLLQPQLFCALGQPQESLQPQFVAVKSLMFFASKGLFMV